MTASSLKRCCGCLLWLVIAGLPVAHGALGSSPASVSEIHRQCQLIQHLLGGQPTDSRDRAAPLTELAGRLQKGDRLDDVAKNTALLDRVAELLDAGVSEELISTPFVDAVHVDRPAAEIAPERDGLELGGSGTRGYIFTLLKKRAATLRKTDAALSQRYYRALARWCASDWFSNGPVMPAIASQAGRQATTVAALMGIDDEKARAFEEAAGAIDAAQRKAFQELGSCAIAVDRAIFAAKRRELSDAEMSRALNAVTYFIRASAPLSDAATWQGCNMAWRLRSAVALLDEDHLQQIDASLVKLEGQVSAEPAIRWVREIRSTKPVEPADSGVHVITDPNDPRLKGTPPQ